MSLYFILMLVTLAGPFLLSFDKKIHFYTHWKELFPAIIVIAIPFIVWDEIFTSWGFWGFNSEYLNGFFIGNLPIEEICFFFFVPYACIFIYEVLIGYFTLKKADNVGNFVSVFIIIAGILLGMMFSDRMYSLISFLMAVILTVLFQFIFKVKWYGNFIVTFLVVQIPFFIVNGILTGIATEKPIVWYNPEEISTIRITTIPIEDFFYNYGMLLLIVAAYHQFKKRRTPLS